MGFHVRLRYGRRANHSIFAVICSYYPPGRLRYVPTLPLIKIYEIMMLLLIITCTLPKFWWNRIYGFANLQSGKVALFYWVLSLSRGAISRYAGPLTVCYVASSKCLFSFFILQIKGVSSAPLHPVESCTRSAGPLSLWMISIKLINTMVPCMVLLVLWMIMGTSMRMPT